MISSNTFLRKKQNNIRFYTKETPSADKPVEFFDCRSVLAGPHVLHGKILAEMAVAVYLGGTAGFFFENTCKVTLG